MRPEARTIGRWARRCKRTRISVSVMAMSAGMSMRSRMRPLGEFRSVEIQARSLSEELDFSRRRPSVVIQAVVEQDISSLGR